MTIHHNKLLLVLLALFALHTSKIEAATNPPSPGNFFTPQTFVGDAGNGYTVYYLSYFNYYTYTDSAPSYIYKFSFGFLYYFGPSGGDLTSDEAYFYDFSTSDYFYTSADLYPYFYSFNLGTFLYYIEGSSPRQFYNFKTNDFVYYPPLR